MAATGTATAAFNNQGAWAVTLAGITTASTSQVFTLKDYLYSSFVIKGTYGAAASLQWQGSNDGGTTWANIGVAITSSSPQAGTLTPDGVFFGLYQLVVTAGDGTTSLGVNLRASLPR